VLEILVNTGERAEQGEQLRIAQQTNVARARFEPPSDVAAFVNGN